MVMHPKRATNRSEARRRSGVRAPPPPDRTASLAVEATAVARYIADMSGQLESMASAARLDLLADFLAMARAEGEASARADASSMALSDQ
jgi:hypothetical protein